MKVVSRPQGLCKQAPDRPQPQVTTTHRDHTTPAVSGESQPGRGAQGSPGARTPSARGARVQGFPCVAPCPSHAFPALWVAFPTRGMMTPRSTLSRATARRLAALPEGRSGVTGLKPRPRGCPAGARRAWSPEERSLGRPSGAGRKESKRFLYALKCGETVFPV